GWWAAFPPAGWSGRIDGDVALQFAFDRGDVDVEVVEDAAGAAARGERGDGEQVFGACLGGGGGGGGGCGVLCGGGQRAGRLGWHGWRLVARGVGGRSEQPVRRGPDALAVDAEAFEDGRGDAFGEQAGEQVLGADLGSVIGFRRTSGVVEAGLQACCGAGGAWQEGPGGDGHEEGAR